MRNINLPGNKRIKIILLSILVLISIGIIITEAVGNRKEKTIDENYNEVQYIENEKSSEEEKDVQEEIEPTEEDNLYNEAYSLFFQGSYLESINKANEILEKYPESFKAYNIRGIAEAFNVSFDEGMKDIDKALEINPDFGYARYNKAFVYELYDRFDEALVWYDKALEIEDYMWSYYGKASIYGRRGDAEKTVEYLNKAIEVEDAKGGESGIKREAKTEKDFDPVRGNEEFENLINN